MPLVEGFLVVLATAESFAIHPQNQNSAGGWRCPALRFAGL